MADHADGPDSAHFALDTEHEFRSSRGPKSANNTNGSGDQASSTKGESKESKLAHVPCKFYKAGACTAGQSCPFSHTVVDKGGPKETCQWFVKGNCKFGHKCALAHLLPGQPIAMDRKNKKAAQLAAQSGSGNTGASGGGGHGHSQSRDFDKGRGRGGKGGLSNTKDRDRPPKPPGGLTATAPTSQTTSDQASPHIPTEASGRPTPPQGESPLSPQPVSQQPVQEGVTSPIQAQTTPITAPSPGQKPLSPGIPEAYRPPMGKRFSSGRPGSSDLGYGPIGSPPNANHIAAAQQSGMGMRSPYANHANHFSPGTSPHAASHMQPSTSPFAQQQSVFGAFRSPNVPNGNPTESNQSPITINRSFRPSIPLSRHRDSENAVGSDDEGEFGEELIPSSLTDLLTPEERHRRASRSGGQRLGHVGLGDGGANASVGGGIGISGNGLGGGGVGSLGAGHRYSRSVPAARLLDNPSIWKDDHSTNPNDLNIASLSFRSTGLGSDAGNFSPNTGSFLPATSNASGAFLNHHGPSHFARASGTSGMQGPSHLTRQIMSQSYEENDVLNSMPTPTTFGAGRTGNFGFNHGVGGYGMQQSRAVQGLEAGILSPSSKALQAHAPGQSLPQGIDAGFRLHLQAGTGGPNGKLSGAGFGGETKAGNGIRSPLRTGFGMGTSPDVQGRYGLAALSSSPGMRSGSANAWGAPSSLSQQLAQQQSAQQGLLAQSLAGFGPPPQIHAGKGRTEGLGGDPVVSAPIPVRAGMGVGGIASLGTHGLASSKPGGAAAHGDTEDGLFQLEF